MTVAKTNLTAPAQLRRNSLGLPELVFQGITHIAPAGNIVFTFPIIARVGWSGHADLAPADDDRMLLYREYSVAVFQVHAIERRLLLFCHPWAWEAAGASWRPGAI